MSIEAYNYSITLKVGDLGAKFVHGRLADRADERFTCFPSVPLIAAEMEKSERTVQRALAYLRERGFISDRENFRADGSQTTNRYQLHGPWDEYGGTGVPFPQIVTPRQVRQEMWAQAPAEGSFRDGTAAAVALIQDEAARQEAVRRAEIARAHAEAIEESKSRRGKKAAEASRKAAQEASRESDGDAPEDVPAGQEGVTDMSPGPTTPVSPPPVTPVSPLEPSAPSHSGDDVFPDGRRPSDGGVRARVGSGSAASGKTKPSPLKQRYSREQWAQIRTVMAGFPAELEVPWIEVVADGIVKALAEDTPQHRTATQLAERIAWRWDVHGWALRLASGEVIRKPVGVALDLIREYGRDDKWGCPNPRCENGTDVDDGTPCNVCPERLAARQTAREHERTQDGQEPPARSVEGQATPVPVPRRQVDPMQNCDRCDHAFRAPEPGVCKDCRAEGAEQLQQPAFAPF
ncbi:helix-turn-helix domain-containing protein [Streptomyces sp. NPDC059740]|uniref:helix-turn-helix domain-containing protein n=1 Tax=Streptomyces sp. NPDC059740 TaxID=3346926 RepID=UPI0036600D3E